MEGIRFARLEDAKALVDIYNPYIKETTITYEYDELSEEAFCRRMQSIMEKFPYLVYEIDGVIVGYAYASPHLERAAFGWDCEVTVYLSPTYQNRGIASRLYEKLIGIVKEMGYVNIYSLIDYPNAGSEALHYKFGFEKLGIYEKTAFKFGKWLDLLVLQKRVGTDEKPEAISLECLKEKWQQKWL